MIMSVVLFWMEQPGFWTGERPARQAQGLFLYLRHRNAPLQTRRPYQSDPRGGIFGVLGAVLIDQGGLNNTRRAGMLLLCGKSSIPYLVELHSEELEEEL
jgi:hypothetical protein